MNSIITPMDFSIFLFSALVFIALILLKINRVILLRLFVLYFAIVSVFLIYLVFHMMKTDTQLDSMLVTLPFILFPLVMPTISIILLLWKKNTKLLLWFLIIYQISLLIFVYGFSLLLRNMH